MSQLFNDFIFKGKIHVYKGPTVDGRLNVHPEDNSDSDSVISETDQSDYAQEYIEKELQTYAKADRRENNEHHDSKLTVDDITADLANSEIRSEVYRLADSDIYSKYNFESSIAKKNLTIHKYRETILDVVQTNSVVVIDGPTGCGKTTQVPQYILDHCRLLNRRCKIVVTQPRKIATINVAKRVCQERGWALGTVCGYQIGLDKQVGPDVILSYMTTGVLLQKLIHSKSLSDYTHIIVDEIHERNQELDFLLLVIRRYLFTKSFETKIILMSATIEAMEFSNYFRTEFRSSDVEAPIVCIKEPNVFKTTTYYMDNLPAPHPAATFDIDKPEISEGVITTFLFLMTVFDKLDDLNHSSTEKNLGSVLVFLPGIREIEEIEKLLNKTQEQKINENIESDLKWQIVPLHSSLPNDEQAKVFQPAAPSLRKVILSTNIAESSITVPDITFVVDFCLTKTLVVNELTKFSSLQLEWASHVNCDQRAGRVGRVSNGRVYRLVPKSFYEEKMDIKNTPEILRAPLDQVVIHSKMLELNEEPKAVLALAINPPNLSNIERTIWHLKEIGAFLQTCRGHKNLFDGDLTALGKIMGGLPLDVQLSKLIVLGHLFSVLHEAVIIAAGCSIQNIFATPYTQRFQAYNKKLLWSDGSCSDLMALLNLYKVWRACKRDGLFRRPHEEFSWCKANLVNLKGLREWHLLITEIQERLKRLGIEETVGPSRVNLQALERATILKVIICGAFYPNYFTKSAVKYDEREAVRALGCRDPYRTVYLNGIEAGQPVGIYSKEIRSLLDLDKDVKVEMDGTTKIYLEFMNDNEIETVNVDGKQYLTKIPGKISMSVYRAIKKRQLNLPLFLNMLPKELAWDHFNNLERIERKKKSLERVCDDEDDDDDVMKGSKDVNCYTPIEFNPFPNFDTIYMTIVITHRIDASHFYCQNTDDNTQEILTDINTIINSTPLRQIDVKNINLEKLYACSYKKDNQYYRAKINIRTSETEAQIIFVDYGNIQSIKLKDLCELPSHALMKTVPLAIECVLSEIEPAYDLHRRGIWSENINQMFDSETQNMILYGKIYSVVDDIVHLELFKQIPQQSSNKAISLNQWLINQGHARKVEESFLSKQDHDLRNFVQASENPHGEAKKLHDEKKKKYKSDLEVSLDGVESLGKPVKLKGPFSPLEMKFISAIGHGNNKIVDIEPTSVNSVLLDSNPLDPHTRLLVAASVNQTSSGDKLLLRQTTIMPSLPGFPYLMALLFCPEMEPKLNEDGSGISAILCGLGTHEYSSNSCFPAHDMVLTLDVEINETIINKINELRYAMSLALEAINKNCNPNTRTEKIDEHQRSIKFKVFPLLKMKMESIEPYHSKNAHLWKNYPLDSDILQPNVTGLDKQNVWPLHWFFKVNKVDDTTSRYQENIKLMTQMAKKLVPFENIFCEICETEFISLGPLRNHLISSQHKQKERNMKVQMGV